MKTKNGYLVKAKALVEAQLRWGNAKDWTNQDFHKLSDLILAKTGCSLSAVTLKRLWGRIQYNSLPSTATLDILVKFAGFENWREFKMKQAHTPEDIISIELLKSSIPGASYLPPKARYSTARIGLLILMMIGLNYASFKFLSQGFITNSKNYSVNNAKSGKSFLDVLKSDFFGTVNLFEPIKQRRKASPLSKPFRSKSGLTLTMDYYRS